MYSAKSYQLTKDEFNYLLPVMRKKLLQSSDRYYFIADDIDDLTDMLNRVKGLYNNYDELKNMVAYYCSKYGSLKPFRDSLQSDNIPKTYTVQICFENPFMPETAYINICTQAHNEEQAHILAVSVLESNLEQSLTINETTTI